jgi:hypothetical protein
VTTAAYVFLAVIAAIVAGLVLAHKRGLLVWKVDDDEDPIESLWRVESIKAALQDESTAHPHISAKNYWGTP